MSDKINSLTCKICGWVHFGLTKQTCESEVQKFNNYFDNLSGENKIKYYGGFIGDETGQLVLNTDILN